MRPIQRYLAAGMMTAATLGTTAAIAPAAQATEAAHAAEAAAGPCNLKKPYKSIPVPKSSDPAVKLSVGLAKVDPLDPKDVKRTRFRVLYCPNKADKKHLDGRSNKVVLKVTLTKGKKTYTNKCEVAQYFRRDLRINDGRPLGHNCYQVAPKSPKGWKATGVLTYDVVTDKRGPFTYKVTNSKLK
ncbi:hypothetical protein [Actinomadura sp. 6N118]|uniref:hypothetical protein n=1 Tax=Actinomadura sp. 6N118 TaxID=3375151 RepID=UPI0037992872